MWKFLPVRAVYSPSYYAMAPGHPFPFRKYEVLRTRLGDEGWPDEDFLEPEPASRADLEPVHEAEYLEDLMALRETLRTLPSELPVDASNRDFALAMAGGTVLACRTALDDGCCVHLGGGFHHAFAGKAEGFCYVNDVAVAIRRLQADGRIERAAVVDLDVHQGNGTAAIFSGDDRVFTFSMHQENLYPVKQRSDLDIGLRDGIQDGPYLDLLRDALPEVLGSRPELVIYLAGADPYREDQLSGLMLTKDGLRERDETVLEECRRHDVPVAVLLAGGYAKRFEDVVEIHLATCRAARALDD